MYYGRIALITQPAIIYTVFTGTRAPATVTVE